MSGPAPDAPPPRLRLGPSPLRDLLDATAPPPLPEAVSARIQGALVALPPPVASGADASKFAGGGGARDGGPNETGAAGASSTALLAKIAMGLAAIALVSVGAFNVSTSRPTNAVDKTEVAVHAPVIAASTPAPVDIGPPPLATPPPSAAPLASPSAAAPALPAALAGLDAELALLNEAHAALAQNPASALAPLRKHASRFPQGALRPEREFLLADALFRAGRIAEARAQIERARPILAGTPYRARLDALEARLPPEDGDGN